MSEETPELLQENQDVFEGLPDQVNLIQAVLKNNANKDAFLKSVHKNELGFQNYLRQVGTDKAMNDIYQFAKTIKPRTLGYVGTGLQKATDKELGGRELNNNLIKSDEGRILGDANGELESRYKTGLRRLDKNDPDYQYLQHYLIPEEDFANAGPEPIFRDGKLFGFNDMDTNKSNVDVDIKSENPFKAEEKTKSISPEAKEALLKAVMANNDYTDNRYQYLMAQRNPYAATGMAFAEMMNNPFKQRDMSAIDLTNAKNRAFNQQVMLDRDKEERSIRLQALKDELAKENYIPDVSVDSDDAWGKKNGLEIQKWYKDQYAAIKNGTDAPSVKKMKLDELKQKYLTKLSDDVGEFNIPKNSIGIEATPRRSMIDKMMTDSSRNAVAGLHRFAYNSGMTDNKKLLDSKQAANFDYNIDAAYRNNGGRGMVLDANNESAIEKNNVPYAKAKRIILNKEPYAKIKYIQENGQLFIGVFSADGKDMLSKLNRDDILQLVKEDKQRQIGLLD